MKYLLIALRIILHAGTSLIFLIAISIPSTLHDWDFAPIFWPTISWAAFSLAFEIWRSTRPETKEKKWYNF
jgi:hypothetical protein